MPWWICKKCFFLLAATASLAAMAAFPVTALAASQVQSGTSVLGHGSTVTFPQLFAAAPVVLTSAQADGKPLSSAAVRVTPRDFTVYLTDSDGGPVSFAWVQWVAFVPDASQGMLGGSIKASDGQRVSFPAFPKIPVVVTNAHKGEKALISGPLHGEPDGFDFSLIDNQGKSVTDAEMTWAAVLPDLKNRFRGGVRLMDDGQMVAVRPVFATNPAFVSCAPGTATGAVDTRQDGYRVYLVRPDGSRPKQILTQWLAFAPPRPTPFPPEGPCDYPTEVYGINLCDIKKAGITWVKINADMPEAIAFARQIGLDVIGLLESKSVLEPYGPTCTSYRPRPLCSVEWEKLWEEHVKTAVGDLKPFGVKVWQIDDQLNRPERNPGPAVDIELRKEIVTIGARAVSALDPHALILVNLYAHVPTLPSDIEIYRKLRDEGLPLNLLGMNYYRGSWDTGGPSVYPKDLERGHALWGGDMMIAGTGFHTYPPHTLTEQDQYVRGVFRYLGDFLEKADWFKGLIWEEYTSNGHQPIVDYFGLRSTEDPMPKPAWYTFIDEIYNHREPPKMLGISYRE